MSGQTLVDSSLIDYYKSIIKVLANDSLQGRPPSSVYEKKSAQFIFTKFNSLPSFKPRFQNFVFKHLDSTHTSKSLNVYYFLNNKSDSTIIIGAHYDHLGLGGPLSRSFLKKGVHNGADDNASGIALLLGLASKYPSWKNKKYNYVFVAYSAHEIGLFGSASFEKYAAKKWKKIALVVNFDMVGRMHPEEKWLKIIGVSNLPDQKLFFEQQTNGLRYRFEPDTLLNQLDTREFYKKGIPCISFTTGVHDDYHKMTDDENKINYIGIELVQQTIEAYLKHF